GYPQLSRVLGEDHCLLHCFLEETRADRTVSGIREEAILAGAVGEPEHEESIDCSVRFALQGASYFEVIPESGPGGFEQGRDFGAVLRVLLLIDNLQPNSHFERHANLYHFPACAPPST